MATPAVQAASCAGAATAVITTTVIVVPTAAFEPSYEPFGTAPSNDTGKVIKDFWPFLVDTDNSGNKKNKDWWEWSFDRLKATDKKTLDAAFKKTQLVKGFATFSGDGSETAASLNELCHWVIKNKGTTDITGSGKENTPLAKNIWKFCSSLDNEPAKLSDDEAKEFNGKIGSSKKGEVISLNWNDKFWALKGIWFKAQSITDQFFSPFKNKSLKEACEKAYKSEKVDNTSTSEKPTENEVVKYCGFKITTN